MRSRVGIAYLFVVGVAHLRDGYLIKQEISSANVLPS